MLVISAVTVAAWWFADRQTRVAVESRLSTIGQSLAAPNYPLTPPVLRAVADLTDTQLVLLNSSFEIVDTTLNFQLLISRQFAFQPYRAKTERRETFLLTMRS